MEQLLPASVRRWKVGHYCFMVPTQANQHSRRRRDFRRRPHSVQAVLGQAEHLRRGHEVYKRLLHEFHPDKHAGETYSAGEITAALIQLWEAVR